MKKLIVLIIIIVAAALGTFYWKNLRGVGPAVRPPPADITKLVPEKPAAPREANTTGMPLTLPPGFSISVFAKDLGGPRVMTIDPRGILLVSLTSQGKVVALPDEDGDGVSDTTIEMVSGLRKPHGIITGAGIANDDLYVAEEHRVSRFVYSRFVYGDDYRAEHAHAFAELPYGDGHFTRTLLNVSGGKPGFIVSTGSSCNVCKEKDARRAALWMFDEHAAFFSAFATGLRNSVFMARHPVTGKIWATEMGRDLLGDNTPPDEINVVEEGKDYGWPYCYGKNIPDTSFDKRATEICKTKTPSHIDLPAHSAPLGLAFIPEEGWPEVWWHDLLVAYHGSWNRSEPTGYKIVRLDLDEQGNFHGAYDFITGWLTQDGALGRPVDILVQPGGKIYISDDKAGVIYLVRYDGEARNPSEVRIEDPAPNDILKSPERISGEARGNWFFEANLPIKILDANGKVLGQVGAQSKDNPPESLRETGRAGWMTTEFVPFEATLEFKTPETDTGTLVIEKDNPSGLPQHAREVRIPIRFR